MDESRLFSDQRGRLPRRQSLALAERVLRAERQKLPINIIFTDDISIRNLNSRYRRRRRSTDVLAFPADPVLGLLGEVYVSIDTARKQAREYGSTLTGEILRLVCHGLLHLCGYEHYAGQQAERMSAREKKYLKERIK